MKLLIVGGAGYIGSHMVEYCQNLNFDITVLDNFSTGHRKFVNGCEIIECDLVNRDDLLKKLNKKKFDGVIHFAGKSLVAESIQRPDIYYQNNVKGTLNLLEALLKNNVNNIVFSSSAAIFGMPTSNKIDENHSKKPINPYGRSKLIVEEIMKDYCISYDLNICSLRYFNAAGASICGSIGELHDPETHLIPNVLISLKQKAVNLKVFGNDYKTPDGTCIRDYLHVQDLAVAHHACLEHMKNNKGFSSFNLGNEDGFSVLDIIQSCERVTGKKIKFDIVDRRAGDPDILVANSKKAKLELGWIPSYKNIDSIIETAWNWHNK